MSTDFERFIQAKATAEQVEIFLKAASVIEELGLYNHWLEIESIMSLEENTDPFQIVNDIEYVLLTGVKIALNNFSIFSSSYDLELLVNIIESITLVEEYEDFGTVLAICGSDQSDEERLAELLALVSSYEFVDFIKVIDSVSHRLLERIENLFSDEETDEEDYATEDSMSQIVSRLKRFMELTGMTVHDSVDQEHSFLIAEQISNGLPLGLEPAMVFSRIEEDIYDLTSERTAQELVAAALASDANNEDIASVAKEQCEELFGDAYLVRSVNLKINELTQKVFDETA